MCHRDWRFTSHLRLDPLLRIAMYSGICLVVVTALQLTSGQALVALWLSELKLGSGRCSVHV